MTEPTRDFPVMDWREVLPLARFEEPDLPPQSKPQPEAQTGETDFTPPQTLGSTVLNEVVHETSSFWLRHDRRTSLRGGHRRPIFPDDNGRQTSVNTRQPRNSRRSPLPPDMYPSHNFDDPQNPHQEPPRQGEQL